MYNLIKIHPTWNNRKKKQGKKKKPDFVDYSEKEATALGQDSCTVCTLHVSLAIAIVTVFCMLYAVCRMQTLSFRHLIARKRDNRHEQEGNPEAMTINSLWIQLNRRV